MSSTTFCIVHVRGQLILRLSVRHEDTDVWHWTILLDSGVLDEGLMPSKVAAQIASQLALERWLERTRRTRLGAGHFDWKDVVI